MWQILGALAAIIGLTGVILLRSVLWPKPTVRERADNEPLGTRISDAIEFKRTGREPSQPCRHYDPDLD